jgi:hypothetical protein
VGHAAGLTPMKLLLGPLHLIFRPMLRTENFVWNMLTTFLFHLLGYPKPSILGRSAIKGSPKWTCTNLSNWLESSETWRSTESSKCMFVVRALYLYKFLRAGAVLTKRSLSRRKNRPILVRCWHRVHLKVLEWDPGGKKPKLHRRYIQEWLPSSLRLLRR